MKIRPVILCGGSGTRLWPNSIKHQAKQFIDFGNWTLFGKSLERIKSSIFDGPIISTNSKYLKQVKQHLKKAKISNYKIVLEPAKKNTAPAILSTALIKDIPMDQPLMFFSADHLIEKTNILNKAIKINKTNLTNKNIFIFGVKPISPSSEFGYFITKKDQRNINKVIKFIEKPKESKAKKIIKQKGYWNSGMFFFRKDSILNNFKKYQPLIYKNCIKAVKKAKYKSKTYYLNKASFLNVNSKSFDYAILEKAKDINSINLDIPWSDLGSWKEILKIFHQNIKKYYKKNFFSIRPWGKYRILFKGKNFIIKELSINPKGLLSLQKHYYRSEHWLVTQGQPKITLNRKVFIKKKNDYIFVPTETIHRIQNLGLKTIKIIEAQVGLILKETDIFRYDDSYGRVTKKC